MQNQVLAGDTNLAAETHVVLAVMTLLAIVIIVMPGCIGQELFGPNQSNQSNNTSNISTGNGSTNDNNQTGNNKVSCVCPTLYQPVCGDDMKNYSNACIAKCAGISILYNGTCGHPECTDSDGGMDSSVRGTVSIAGLQYQDYCRAFESVEEYYCKNNAALVKSIPCESGYECRDGACIPKTEPAPDLCEDSDAKDIYTKGTVNLSGIVYEDGCTAYKQVHEYYCQDGKVRDAIFDCPMNYKCSAGRCTRIDSTCTDTDGGRNENQAGYVTVTVGLTSAQYLDKCHDDHSVLEYYCENGNYVSEIITCPADQGCMKASCQIEICVDSDGGYSIYRKGMVSKGSDTYRDSCANRKEGMEYYCDGNTVLSKAFTCPSGYDCEDGRCE